MTREVVSFTIRWSDNSASLVHCNDDGGFTVGNPEGSGWITADPDRIRPVVSALQSLTLKSNALIS